MAVRRLSEIELRREGAAILLDLQDEAGARLTFIVEEEQLDLLADHIDDLLGAGTGD